MKTITFSAPCIKRYETDEFKPASTPKFIAVSLNGAVCHLQCDHCRTRMLQALYHAQSPEQFLRLCETKARAGCEAVLLTGGCLANGTIPLAEYAEVAALVRVRHGLRFAAHTKLVTEEFARAAAGIPVETLMTDVVGEEDSLHEVYHLRRYGLRDVERSLDVAERYNLPLAPHIMIGIARGRVAGEYRALEMLRSRPLQTLVLVVLTPLRNTPMESVQVDVDGALDVMTKARALFPETRITLGCAKLGGAKQRRLEEHALALGFDAIAYPSEGMLARAGEMGYEVKTSEWCCALSGLR